jgi:hypothetical protein
VSVVGFDDLPEAALPHPALTTVRQDFAELGRRGVQAGAGPREDLVPEPVTSGARGASSTGSVPLGAARRV